MATPAGANWSTLRDQRQVIHSWAAQIGPSIRLAIFRKADSSGRNRHTDDDGKLPGRYRRAEISAIDAQLVPAAEINWSGPCGKSLSK